MAPKESRFADIPISLKQIKENKSDRGITIETISVVRQLNINSDTIKVTNKIPSTRLCNTVPVA